MATCGTASMHIAYKLLPECKQSQRSTQNRLALIRNPTESKCDVAVVCEVNLKSTKHFLVFQASASEIHQLESEVEYYTG